MILSEVVKHRVRSVMNTWNACDPPTSISADAAMQIAEAACEEFLGDVTTALRQWHGSDPFAEGNAAARFLEQEFT